MCIALEGISALSRAKLRKRTAWKTSDEAAEAIGFLVAGFIRTVEIGLAGVFSALAIALPLAPSFSHSKLMLLTFLWLAGLVAAGCFRMAKGAAELKSAGFGQGIEGWNGIVYRNPNDPRLWVPKITGVGYTLNFARPAAWWIMGGVLLIPLIALVSVLRSLF
jgi:uncharacterized membrane protein